MLELRGAIEKALYVPLGLAGQHVPLNTNPLSVISAGFVLTFAPFLLLKVKKFGIQV